MQDLVSNKPRKTARQDVHDHVWSADEAETFLKTAKVAGAQPAAFYTLALDTGARRGERGQGTMPPSIERLTTASADLNVSSARDASEASRTFRAGRQTRKGVRACYA
jgi:hypothetical protein